MVIMAGMLEHILKYGELITSIAYQHMMFATVVLVVLCLSYIRKARIFILDFSCYRPPSCQRLPHAMFAENAILDERITPESAAFQIKILEKSGFSEETCASAAQCTVPIGKSLNGALEETRTVVFSVVDDLLRKSKTNPRSIDILITNCSMFSPTPSISAQIVNKFQMRSNIMSLNLSGMGCSAGIVSLGLAKDLLSVHRSSLALVVSNETLHLNYYTGKNRSMLLTNCLFRMGGAAVLVSNRDQDKKTAKYEIQHLVRVNKAQNDKAYGCVFQDMDEDDKLGVSISKEIVNVAGDALKANLATLGTLVLPFSEKLQYGISLILQMMNAIRKQDIYIPDFKRAFDHFCIHAGGRAVIYAVEKNLRLNEENVEASKMTLYRFGNTSSSSIWYELCYIEAKGKMKKGDTIWQIAFGSGFKCNSAVLKCLSANEKHKTADAWTDCIDSYPVNIPDEVKIC